MTERTYEADYVVRIICMHDKIKDPPLPTTVETVFHRPQPADRLTFGRLEWLSEGDSLQTFVGELERLMEERGVSEETRKEIRRDPRKQEAFLTSTNGAMDYVRWRFHCEVCDTTIVRANTETEAALEVLRKLDTPVVLLQDLA